MGEQEVLICYVILVLGLQISSERCLLRKVVSPLPKCSVTSRRECVWYEQTPAVWYMCEKLPLVHGSKSCVEVLNVPSSP